MIIIAVYNCKGGVGKTTCTLNLSQELVRAGLCVLLVDLDGQCDLTSQCQQQPGKPGGRHGNDILSVLKGMKKAVDVAVPVKGTQNLYIIPGHTKIESFDFEHSQKMLLDSLQQPGLEDVDLVLIDFPSAANPAAICGLLAADYVLLVTEAERLSMDNLENGFAFISEVTELKKKLLKDRNVRVEALGILANKVDRRRDLTEKNLKLLREKYPDLLLKTYLSTNTGIVNSQDRQTAVRNMPFRPVSVSQFSWAAREVLDRLAEKGVTFFEESETEGSA